MSHKLKLISNFFQLRLLKNVTNNTLSEAEKSQVIPAKNVVKNAKKVNK